jgi:hypothetical protein
MPRRAVFRHISCVSDFDPPQKKKNASLLPSYTHSFSPYLLLIITEKRSDKTRTEENLVANRKKCNDKVYSFRSCAPN